jgi:hypothetical protein
MAKFNPITILSHSVLARNARVEYAGRNFNITIEQLIIAASRNHCMREGLPQFEQGKRPMSRSFAGTEGRWHCV